MTQEEKQLLIKDLCGRLPYGVKTSSGPGILELTPRTDVTYIVNNGHIPYLRPMSSMTEEEKREVREFGVSDDGAFHNDIYDVGTSMEEAFTAISWFLERHFDINYLIPKGLALNAPKGMYKTE